MQTVGALISTRVPSGFPACRLALLTVGPPVIQRLSRTQDQCSLWLAFALSSAFYTEQLIGMLLAPMVSVSNLWLDTDFC